MSNASSHFPFLSSQTPRWRDGLLRTLAPSEVEGTRGSAARQSFRRWLKFNFVGGIGIVVQLAALTVLRSALHLDYLLATVAAVEIAVLHNFLWHERFTWADRQTHRIATSLARLLRFNLSNGAVSIVGNLLLMRLLVGRFQVHYIVANLIAITACSVANFLLSDRLVFRHLPMLEAPHR